MAALTLRKYIEGLIAPVITAFGNTQSIIQNQGTVGLTYSWESGALTAGQVIANPAMPVNITLTGTGYASCDQGLLSPTVLPIYEDLLMNNGSIVSGTSIGSVVFPSGATTGTVTTQPVIVSPGHKIGVLAVTTPDSSFQNPQITIIGHR